ncbi:MAG: hypothetical protein ACK5X0_11340 [Rhodospirillales bacterium]|jgi:phosphoribosylformylglycinamidine (FGAM) synthase-like amidotransferase family enzyme
MNKQAIIYSLAAIVCSVAGNVHAAEIAQAQPNVMFCTEEGTNGFYYNQQQRRYEATKFNPQRHTVNIRGSFESIEMSTSGVSVTYTMQCHPSRYTEYSHIRECSDGASYSFTYNTRNNRFTYSMQYGYVYVDDDAIGISYGTCARF